MILANDSNSFIWWKWVGDHTELIKNATFEHLRLTVIAVMFGFAIWHLRRQAAERERAAAERLANFMAQSLPAAQPASKPNARAAWKKLPSSRYKKFRPFDQ